MQAHSPQWTFGQGARHRGGRGQCRAQRRSYSDPDLVAQRGELAGGDPGGDAFPVEEVDEVVGRDVPGRARRERAAADAARRIVGTAMVLVALDIALLGPRTTGRPLETVDG
jgi:hypothetical protein